MSKGSLFWANASGKLGEVVHYRSGGEQRARTYVAKIKNPKTLAQMKNRLSMKNFSSIYRSLQPILSKSFPNRPAKESGFNAFVKANKSVRSAVLSSVGASRGLSVPYDMLLSKGYLTQFGEFKRIQVGSDGFIAGFDLSSHPNLSKIKEIWPAYDELFEGFESQEQYESCWDALGLPSDAKITVIVGSYMDEGYSLSYQQFERTTPYTEVQNSPWNGQMFTFQENETSVYTLRFGPADSESLVCAIISWVDATGKLQVTNSRMVVPSADEEYATQFVEGGSVYEEVLNDYGYNQDSLL